MFIPYFNGPILQKNIAKVESFEKKYEEGWPFRGVVFRRGAQTYYTVC